MKFFIQGLLLVNVAIFLFSTSTTAIAATFVYDWSTANSSAAGLFVDTDAGNENNDSWMSNTATTGDGTGDVVRSTGQPDGNFVGNFYQSLDTEPGNGDSIYDRLNDTNFSYSVPSGTPAVEVSMIIRASTDLGGSIGLLSSGTSTALSFGSSSLGWRIREPSGAITNLNGSGAGLLNGIARTYRVTLTADLSNPGSVKSIDLLVENLSDGGSELIYDDLPFDLSPMNDVTTWDGLSMRVNGSSTTAAALDNIIITTIPEPTTVALATFALLGIGHRRRKRA